MKRRGVSFFWRVQYYHIYFGVIWICSYGAMLLQDKKKSRCTLSFLSEILFWQDALRDRPIFCTDLQIRTTFRFRWVGGFEEDGCSDLGSGNNPYTLLRSAMGITHVLRSVLVMGYATTLALKLSVAPPVYPWVTATRMKFHFYSFLIQLKLFGGMWPVGWSGGMPGNGALFEKVFLV